jgi:hypothetical protein
MNTSIDSAVLIQLPEKDHLWDQFSNNRNYLSRLPNPNFKTENFTEERLRRWPLIKNGKVIEKTRNLKIPQKPKPSNNDKQ